MLIIRKDLQNTILVNPLVMVIIISFIYVFLVLDLHSDHSFLSLPTFWPLESLAIWQTEQTNNSLSPELSLAKLYLAPYIKE